MRAPAGAIDRALAVLGVLADAAQPMGVTEIARIVGLPKSVVHYHVSALVRNRYVEARPDRRYGLGAAALRLGRGSQSSRELCARALPHMRALHRDTWETVTLSVLVGMDEVFVDQLVSPQEIKLAIELGRPHPLTAGASGRAILAFLPAAAQACVTAAPRALLDEIREAGVSVSRCERQPGAAAVAAPVFDGRGVVGALCVCGPEHRFDDAATRRYQPLLRAAAAALSRELGGR